MTSNYLEIEIHVRGDRQTDRLPFLIAIEGEREGELFINDNDVYGQTYAR